VYTSYPINLKKRDHFGDLDAIKRFHVRRETRGGGVSTVMNLPVP
jgi:hypothetical protein